MKTSDLPQSELVGFASEVEALALLLDKAVDHSGPFMYFGRALGALRSCRILFQNKIDPYTETAPLQKPYDSKATAIEFLREDFLSEARYNPTTPHEDRAVKGWEVRKAIHQNQVMVIVWASWMRRPLTWDDVRVVDEPISQSDPIAGWVECPDCNHYPCHYHVVNANHPRGIQIGVDCIECSIREVPKDDLMIVIPKTERLEKSLAFVKENGRWPTDSEITW